MHQDSAPKAEVQPPVAAQDLDKEDAEVIVWSTGAGPDAKDVAHRKMPQKGSTPSPLIASGQSPDRTGWRFNKAGQIDDSASHWAIADEMRKLQISDAKDVGAANAVPGSNAVSANSRKSTSPVATPTSSSSSSPPTTKSTRLNRHSRDPSYSDTSSSDSSVVTPLHIKTISGVSAADSDTMNHAMTDAEYHQLQNLHDAKQEANGQAKDFNGPTFPTIIQNSYPPQHHPRPPHLAVVPGYDYRHQGTRAQAQQGEVTPDYNTRHFAPATNGNMSAPTEQRPGQFNHTGRQEPYRAQRGTVSASYVMSPPHVAMSSAASVLTSPQSVPAAAFYPGMAAHPGHALQANMYDMMVQGQHDGSRQAPYRTTHQHSVSDPASLRDATTLALIGNSLHVMQQQHQAQPQHTSAIMAGYPGVFSPGSAPLYPNQFYGHSMVSDMDMVTALARLPPPFNVGHPGYPPAQPLDPQLTGGPSANNRKLGLYKTELCRSWEEKGSCRYGPKCQFAHGEEEIRKVARHPKYKTEICRTFWVSGSCPYGKRCCFIHTELPSSGAPGAPGAGASPEEQRAYQNNLNAQVNGSAGRTRSLSTGSDPNEPQSSLLARISAKRNESAENASPNGASAGYARANNNSALRVDTNVMDHGKPGNYPYTSNPALPAAGVRALSDLANGGVSPAPASAAPDFGRQRMEAFNHRLNNNAGQTSQGHVRHQYNNSESGPQQLSGSSPFSADGPRVSPPHGHGHMRSDSGSSHQWAPTNGPRTGWAPEIAVAAGRYNDRPWA